MARRPLIALSLLCSLSLGCRNDGDGGKGGADDTAASSGGDEDDGDEDDGGEEDDTGGEDGGGEDGGGEDGGGEDGGGEDGGGEDGGGEDGGGEDGGGEDGGGEDGGGSGTEPTEICNGIDDDGDGLIDEDDVCGEPVETEPESGHAYLFRLTGSTWPAAQAYCRSIGYDLVTIDSQEENDWLHEAIYDGTDGVGQLNVNTWIGYQEAVGATAWSWSDGTAPAFEAWSGDVTEDDYGTPTFGQAAAFHDYTTAHWEEVPANWVYAAVCESSGS